MEIEDQKPAQAPAHKAAAADAARAAEAAHRLEFFRRLQDGVVSRRQLTEGGLRKHDIERLVRRRRLRQVLPRVYVDHTGPLTRTQREWAALLYAEPAALCWRIGEKAGHKASDDVHVAIDHRRRVAPQPGVRIHRVRAFTAMLDGRRRPALSPEDDALCMVHEAADELAVVATLAEVAAAGVSGLRLRRALTRHPSLHRRRFVAALIEDVVSGTHSVLEHGYLTRVQRPHGLPPLERQAPRSSRRGRERRDAEYGAFGLVIELDGRLNHESWQAGNRDAERDLDDLAAGRAVARLRWQQVYGAPCRTAGRIAQALRARGWAGEAHRCGPACELSPG